MKHAVCLLTRCLVNPKAMSVKIPFTNACVLYASFLSVCVRLNKRVPYAIYIHIYCLIRRYSNIHIPNHQLNPGQSF